MEPLRGSKWHRRTIEFGRVFLVNKSLQHSGGYTSPSLGNGRIDRARIQFSHGKALGFSASTNVSKSENHDFEYERHSGGENLEVMLEAKNYNNFLQQLIRKFSGDATTALDFGAGIGTFSGSLNIPPQHVHCVEPDSDARELLMGKGFQVHQSLSEVDTKSISYVFTLNVLEHIEDDVAILRELFRVLEPGGQILVYVPAFALLYTSMDAHVGHHRRYRMAELVKKMNQAGFNVHKKAYADALGFFATLAYRLVDKSEPAPLNHQVVKLYDRYLFPLSRILSIPLCKILGKNLYLVATRPAE